MGNEFKDEQFKSIYLVGSLFSYTRFQSSEFEQWELTSGELDSCMFSKCVFVNGVSYWNNIFDSHFVSCKFDSVRFCGDFLQNVKFTDCELRNVSFELSNVGSPCTLENVLFTGCDFEDCFSLDAKYRKAGPPKGLAVRTS